MANSPGEPGGRDPIEISGPYKFNPPPHHMTFPFAQNGIAQGIGRSLNIDRLGYIVPKTAFYFSEFATPFGFRFIYNPAQITIGTTNNRDIIPGAMSDFLPLYTGTQAIQCELLLNRQYDLFSNNYNESVSVEDRNGILTRGTDWDLEYLFRSINGGPYNETTRPFKTGDIGTVFMNLMEIHFSNELSYKGFINSVTVVHNQFSENMVPMLTTLTFTFTRMTSFDMSVANQDPNAQDQGGGADVPYLPGQGPPDNPYGDG